MKTEWSCSVVAMAWLFVLAIIVLVSFWTDRNLEFWISYFKGHEVHVPWILSFLLTLVANGVIVLANLIGEIARLCV